jgi:hypothetical protein
MGALYFVMAVFNFTAYVASSMTWFSFTFSTEVLVIYNTKYFKNKVVTVRKAFSSVKIRVIHLNPHCFTNDS